MTDHPEHESSVPPASQFNDGWWDAIIAAVLEELDGPPEEERERGLGR